MPIPLLRAHAHNDYSHTRPLLDALEQGFCSVEADIYLDHGQLLVGHDRKDLTPERTLTKLYLEPLWKHALLNRGQIYPTPAPLTLLIDIKTEGARVYAALKETLAPYAPMLTRFERGKIERRAVTVILSGDRPRSVLAAERYRLAALDGRPDDLKGEAPASLIPWISESWLTLFRWWGMGVMPRAERQKLLDLVELAHAQGREVRFWAAPDNTLGWDIQNRAGVDRINTDHLAELAAYFQRQRNL